MERKTKYRLLSVFIVVAGVVLTAILIGLLFSTASMKEEIETARVENEQLQLENQHLKLANEYQSLDAQFQQIENQKLTVKADPLVAKYEAAKGRIEKLLKELDKEKAKTVDRERRIKELEAEIATLKDILKHYVEQIDALGKENESLKAENEEVKSQNAQLSSQVSEARQKNEVLTEKMTLAEKLNVTGISFTALNKKGKVEKNIDKAKQLLVSFTIPQNNSTPVGEKKMYVRITTPEGNLLGTSGSFSFEGKQLQYTARKSVEYAGEEISGIKIYWDVNTILSRGEYLVEIFTDGYRLASRKFNM